MPHEIGISIIHNAIKSSDESNINSLLKTVGWYSQALAIRREQKPNSDQLVSDPLFLGALKDRQKSIDEAKAFFVEAFEKDQYAGTYLAVYDEARDLSRTMQR